MILFEECAGLEPCGFGGPVRRLGPGRLSALVMVESECKENVCYNLRFVELVGTTPLMAPQVPSLKNSKSMITVREKMRLTH